ncbi:unnamed protein product [Schistosoma mattheei]|uniref:Uncharacterized protein n=1 Tax=Schistosoma mattheei TaxID=31246 RepID=A0A183P7Z6_9TREM|nr:unnamed protein product [Schistosoma mattheei]
MKACATNDYYQYLPTVGAVSNLMKLHSTKRYHETYRLWLITNTVC